MLIREPSVTSQQNSVKLIRTLPSLQTMEVSPKLRKRKTQCVIKTCKNLKTIPFFYHSFPISRPAIFKKWVSFVKAKQPEWKGPTRRSLVCSNHFESECFEKRPILKEVFFGKPCGKKLKPEAFPTLYSKTDPNHLSLSSTSKEQLHGIKLAEVSFLE